MKIMNRNQPIKRKLLLGLTAAFLLSMSLSACSKADKEQSVTPTASPTAPSATASAVPSDPPTAAPNEDQDDRLLKAFQEQAQAAGQTGEELNRLLDEDLKDIISTKTGDAVLRALLGFYEKDLPVQEKVLDAEDVQKQLQQLDWPLNEAQVASIKDAAIRGSIEKMMASGYLVDTTEGYAFPVVDYSKLKRAGSVISSAMKDYLALHAMESDQMTASDGGLVIGWEELASRTLLTEQYIQKYPASQEREEVEQIYTGYIQNFLIGLDNTPIYQDETFKLDPEVQAVYVATVKAHPDTVTAKLTKQLLDLAAHNNGLLFKKDKEGNQADIPEVKAFRDSLVKRARDLLDEANPNK